MRQRPLRPGPANRLTDVAGVRVGHATHPHHPTGATAVVFESPAVASTSVMGGGPGTRGASASAPGALSIPIDAAALSGGSAFGLAAAEGVMAELAEAGRGFAVGAARVPIVPGAIIFDLRDLNLAADPDRPWRALGQTAAREAAVDFALGSVGAGRGARAGAIKGGVGTASLTDGVVTVGALAVANPVGSVLVPGSRAFWAAPFERDGEFGGEPWTGGPIEDLSIALPFDAAVGANTTLAVVATDAKLDRAEAHRVALMAQDGLARAIRPVHSPLDGDTVFAAATGAVDAGEPVLAVTRIGAMAADCVARAVARGVFEAEAVDEAPAWRDLTPDRPA